MFRHTDNRTWPLLSFLVLTRASVSPLSASNWVQILSSCLLEKFYRGFFHYNFKVSNVSIFFGGVAIQLCALRIWIQWNSQNSQALRGIFGHGSKMRQTRKTAMIPIGEFFDIARADLPIIYALNASIETRIQICSGLLVPESAYRPRAS